MKTCQEHKGFVVLFEEHRGCPVCYLEKIYDEEVYINEQIQKDIEMWQSQVEDGECRIKDLEEEISDYKNEIDALNHDIKILEEEIRDLRDAEC